MEHYQKNGILTAMTAVFITLTFLSGFAGHADAGVLLADFGGTETENMFGLPGWDTVIRDRYTDYRASGPGGTTIVTGSDKFYNYQGVTGDARFFADRDILIVTWHNNSDTEITFTPKISLDDPDRRTMGVAGTWHDMGAVTIPGRGTGLSLFEFDISSQGTHALVNVNVNYANHGTLICDRIELAPGDGEPDTEAPSVPENVTAEILPGQRIGLVWEPSWDNMAVAGYRIYNGDDTDAGRAAGTSHIAGGPAPGTYTYTVTACDAAGNESGHSDPVTVTLETDPPVTLIDFGGTETENMFGLPGWDTVIRDRYTDYRASGPEGPQS